MNLTLRAFGRICHVFKGKLSGNTFKQVRIIGVDMERNPQLRFAPHLLRLSVPVNFIADFDRRPEATMYASVADHSEIEQSYIWDVTQCDLTIEGIRPGRVVVERAEGQNAKTGDEPAVLPDLRRLSGSLVRSGVRSILDPKVNSDPKNSAASCIVTVTSGVFRNVSPAGSRRVEYVPFDPLEPGPDPAILERVPTGAEVEMPATGKRVTIRVRRRVDGRTWFVTVGAGRVVSGDPIATLSNTCGCEIGNSPGRRDDEFAAYYELLAKPGIPEGRLIPVHVRDQGGAGCDNPSSFTE